MIEARGRVRDDGPIFLRIFRCTTGLRSGTRCGQRGPHPVGSVTGSSRGECLRAGTGRQAWNCGLLWRGAGRRRERTGYEHRPGSPALLARRRREEGGQARSTCEQQSSYSRSDQSHVYPRHAPILSQQSWPIKRKRDLEGPKITLADAPARRGYEDTSL